MTLRWRLALTVSALIVALAATGAFVVAVLHQNLGRQQDQQLLAQWRELAARASATATHPAPGSPADDRLPDVAVGTTPAGAPVDARPRLPALAPGVVLGHLTAPGQALAPFSVTVQGQDYRVVAARTPSGPVVVAIAADAPLAATERRVLITLLGAGAGVLLLLAAMAWWVERLGLRPIRQVATAADAMAGGDLEVRIPDPDPGTEAGRLARSFNTMAERRGEVDERMRQFIADASHELRTPLTTVAGVLELIGTGRLTGRQREEGIARARAEQARMSALVDDLLMLTTLDEAPLRHTQVDLARIVGDLVADLRMVQPGRLLSWQSAGVTTLDGDEERLRQVAANLIGNALSHTAADVAVDVVVRRDHADVVLEVADTGPGMSREHAARAFDRFYRADPARRRGAGGTGLGLAIARSAVLAHGGRIDLDTAPGAGCRFTVRLPAGAFQETSRVI